MIETIAKRQMTHNGVTYAKGATVPMTQQQYDDDLGPKGLGWVEVAPKPPAPKPEMKAGKPA